MIMGKVITEISKHPWLVEGKYILKDINLRENWYEMKKCLSRNRSGKSTLDLL